MSAQEHSATEVTPTLALASTQERLTVPMSSSVIPTSGAPANDTIHQLAAGEGGNRDLWWEGVLLVRTDIRRYVYLVCSHRGQLN